MCNTTSGSGFSILNRVESKRSFVGSYSVLILGNKKFKKYIDIVTYVRDFYSKQIIEKGEKDSKGNYYTEYNLDAYHAVNNFINDKGKGSFKNLLKKYVAILNYKKDFKIQLGVLIDSLYVLDSCYYVIYLGKCIAKVEKDVVDFGVVQYTIYNKVNKSSETYYCLKDLMYEISKTVTSLDEQAFDGFDSVCRYNNNMYNQRKLLKSRVKE